MVFTETELRGAYRIDLECRGDERGFFARAFCAREFAEHGLNVGVLNTNVSRSRRRGTLRGLHFQRPPHAEAKLVRCTRGSIYDVIVDLRRSSPTYRRWVGLELTENNHRMLYVPEGCAHGFLTLADDSEVVYQVSEFYAPQAEGGIRYDDPAFDIEWPEPIIVISDKDRDWPAFEADGDPLVAVPAGDLRPASRAPEVVR